MQSAKDISSHRFYWANKFGSGPFLPMTRDEIDTLPATR
jgi:hypothetical protein